MKIFSKILTALAVAAVCLLPARADVIGLGGPAVNGFCTSSTNQASALSWAVVTSRSGNNGTPVVTFLGYGSDLAAFQIQSYKVNAQCVCNFTNSTVTIPVNTTNGFNAAGSAVIVIRHKLTDDYEKRILTTSTGTTNLVTTVGAQETIVPGDTIYQCIKTGAGSLVGGAAITNTLAAPGGIFIGQQGLPLLLEINGTSGASLYSASGYFLPPVVAGKIGTAQ